jgi:four helix bundle protein
MLNKITDIEVYVLSEELSNKIWEIVKKWNWFEKDTLGKQLVKAADSISANIAESHGRFHYKDKQKFGYYARGSLEETKSWVRKSYVRRLVTKDQFTEIKDYLKKMGPKLNGLIRTFKSPHF